MPSQTRTATVIVNDDSIGVIDWANPGNAAAEDGSLSTVPGPDGDYSHYLKGTVCGFTIPEGNTVIDVTLRIKWRDAYVPPASTAASLRLVKNGVISGDDAGDAGSMDKMLPDSLTWQSFQPDDPLWSLSLGASDINSNGFGYVIAIFGIDPSCHPEIDCVELTVTHSSPTVDRTQTGRARLQKPSDRTVSARTRVTAKDDRTQAARSRLRKTFDRTQPASSRLIAKDDRAQTGRGRLRKSSDQAQLARTRVTAKNDRAQIGRGRLRKSSDQPQSARTRIGGLSDRTQPARTRLTAKDEKAQSARSRLRKLSDRTQSGKTWINLKSNESQGGRARLKKSSNRMQLAQARISTVGNPTDKSVGGVSCVIKISASLPRAENRTTYDVSPLRITLDDSPVRSIVDIS